MVYEARPSAGFNYALAGACVLLSLLGFVAAGVIPSESTRVGGTYPLVGWTIVAGCVAAALEFLRRALRGGLRLRLDETGVLVPAHSPETVPWEALAGVQPLRLGVQRIVRFALRDPDLYPPTGALRRAVGKADSALGFGHFGANITHCQPGMAALLATVRHYRPDLVEGAHWA